jgi:hypothetical protein
MAIMQKQNHLGTPTPRCFPDWMRRLNPYLKKEDTNAFFETQRRINDIYEKSRESNKSQNIILLVFILINLGLVMVFSANLLWMLPSILFFATFLAPKALRDPIRQETDVLCSDFLKNINKDFLQDLWLSRIGGKELFEGLILASGISLRYSAFFLALIPFIPPLIFVYIMTSMDFFSILICLLIALPAEVYLAFQIYIYRFSYYPMQSDDWVAQFRKILAPSSRKIPDISKKKFHANIRKRKREDAINRLSIKRLFCNPGKAFRSMVRKLKKSLLELFHFLYIIVIIFAVVCLGGFISSKFHFSYHFDVFVVSSAIYLVIGSEIKKKRRKTWIKSIRGINKIITELDGYFHDYVQRVCCNDDAPENLSLPPTEDSKPDNAP